MKRNSQLLLREALKLSHEKVSCVEIFWVEIFWVRNVKIVFLRARNWLSCVGVDLVEIHDKRSRNVFFNFFKVFFYFLISFSDSRHWIYELLEASEQNCILYILYNILLTQESKNRKTRVWVLVGGGCGSIHVSCKLINFVVTLIVVAEYLRHFRLLRVISLFLSLSVMSTKIH